MNKTFYKWMVKKPIVFTLIRILLGIILVSRGIYFFINIDPLYYLIKDSRLTALNVSMPLALTISTMHVVGGTFITLGFLTRLFAWTQIPIVVSAIVFINLGNSLAFTYPGLLFSVFVLALLILIAAEGAGEISMDNYLKKYLL